MNPITLCNLCKPLTIRTTENSQVFLPCLFLDRGCTIVRQRRCLGCCSGWRVARESLALAQGGEQAFSLPSTYFTREEWEEELVDRIFYSGLLKNSRMATMEESAQIETIYFVIRV